jgi:hypothetical protein
VACNCMWFHRFDTISAMAWLASWALSETVVILVHRLAWLVWSAISLLKCSLGFSHQSECFAWRCLFSLLGTIAWFAKFSLQRTHRTWLLFSRCNESEGQIVFIISAHGGFRSINLSIHLSIYLYIYIYIYLSIYLSIYICLSIYIYIYLSIYICLSIYLSIYISVYLYIYISVYLLLYSSLLDLGQFFSFLIFHADDRTPWTGDKPVARPLPAHRIEQAG